MKNFRSFILIFLLSFHISVLGQTGPPACNDFLKIKGKDFYCGGNRFYPLVCNYRFTLAHNGLNPTSSDYYLSPYAWYGINSDFDCVDEGTCLQKLSDDFAIIHKLGFNAIRTTHIAPRYDQDNHTTNGGNFQELGTLTTNDFAVWASCNVGANFTWCGKSFIFNPDHNAFDANRNRYLQITRSLLETAYANSLKVFLDVTGGKAIDPVWYHGYTEWITTLVQYIKSLPINLQHTIAAYVVIEEPISSSVGMYGVGYDKNRICEKTTEIYDLIHGIDSVHLITIGGGEPDLALQNWDSGVMKYDFVSPHLYPFYRIDSLGNGEQNSDFAVERVLSELYWLKNYCPYPFMIGETGFGAINDDPSVGVQHYPKVNGLVDTDPNAYYNQKNYTHDVMKMTRDCGGSGFSIWQYQEGGGDPYGILGVGNASTSWTTLKKPLCDEFANYLDANGLPPDPDPNGGQMPAFYYDPYHYGTTITQGAFIGTVEDIDFQTQKVKGAMIYGSLDMKLPTALKSDYTFNYTYSREEVGHEGEFYLLPYDWKHFVVKPIGDIYISAVGTSRLHYGGDPTYGYTSTSSTINGNAYLLKRSTVHDQNNIQNITLNASQNGNYAGFTRLNVSDFTAEAQSTVDMKGSIEVNVFKETTFKEGSEVLIHIDQVFPECSEFSSYLKIKNPAIVSQPQTNNSFDNIELDFRSIKNKMIVYPNPTSGNITISFTKNEIPFSMIKIQNVYGETVHEINTYKDDLSIDLSFLPKGMYFITGMSKTDRQSLKLIIN